jgi:hypothetical protein
MKRSALAIVVLLVVVPKESFAGDPLEDFPDPDAAQSLYVEARALIQQSRYGEACPKLEESLRLVPGLGTELDLAECNEQIGKLAAAWSGFVEVAARAKSTRQAEREKIARKRASALEPRLPKLVIDVASAPPGLEVKRDGVVVDAAAWGTAFPVDPGRHRVTVTAPGKQRWVTTVVTLEGTTTRVEAPRELVAAPSAAAPEEAVAPPAAPAPTAEPVAPASEPIGPMMSTSTAPPAPEERAPLPPPVLEEPGAKRRTLAWLVAGAGAVGLGVGTAFGIASLGNREDARSQCVGDSCNTAGVRLRDDAMRNGNVATASTVIGAAALVGGLVLMFTAPRRPERR